jgi:hypothetical protein
VDRPTHRGSGNCSKNSGAAASPLSTGNGSICRNIQRSSPGDGQGLAIYRTAPRAELLLLHAERAGAGVGTALVERVLQTCFEGGAPQLSVTTTNDNLNALGFYQRLGFRIVDIRVAAVDRARLLKPQIPALGNSGIPIRDEIELAIKREGANRRPP